MLLDVFDTYANDENGEFVHFDVLVPKGTDKETAIGYANDYLLSIGLRDRKLNVARCNFCHTEAGKDEVKKLVEANGHYILPLEGCPQ